MNSQEIRQAYLDFFKDHGHAVVPSSSLLPENDPTTLFTGSGMQPMIQYLLGATHPLGTRVTDSQLCFRTGDIDEVGDNRHTTFFEMLGNWSFGDYFKTEQLPWVFEFLTKKIGLDPKRLYVTVFRGNEELALPRDTVSAELWQKMFSEQGIDAPIVDFAERDGMQGGRIFYYPEQKNWWSRAGVPTNMPVGEPGGPDSEMFWDFGADRNLHEQSAWKDEPCHVNCDCGRFLEIGNSVFMEYLRTAEGFTPLQHKNVDFGGGLERVAMAAQDTHDIFTIDIFAPIIKKLEALSGRPYAGAEVDRRAMRIIADHLRAATFLIADGAAPSNKDQGYFVRRLIRRAVRFSRDLSIDAKGQSVAALIAEQIVMTYATAYPHLVEQRDFILQELTTEEEKFGKTIAKGLQEFEKMAGTGNVSGADAFILFSTYGFPLEMTKELATERGIAIDQAQFDEEFRKHQDLSRTASAGKFKGGLADHSVETTRLHTAHHLLLAALRKTLGNHVEQRGSNITAERLRIDFSHPDKLTAEQLKTVEDLVNQKIQEDLTVEWQEVSIDEARQMDAVGVFGHKYGDRVKVYKMWNAQTGEVFSLEICGGPHVTHTAELGHFSITEEAASSGGVRRIKAILQ